MRGIRSVVFGIGLCSVCAAQAPTPNTSDPHPKFLPELESVRSSLQSAAAALPLLETDDLMYRRWPRQPPSIQATYRRTLSRLIEANYSSEYLIYLAEDSRPTVRTLAIALLFDKEEPKLLRYIADHLNDTAETFPRRVMTDNEPDPMPTQPQTVGEVAQLMVGAYLLAAGMSGAPQGEWVVYQRTHHDRPYYLSWFEVRLGRVTGLISPFQEDRRPHLIRLRAGLDKLGELDRNLYLLWLSQPGGLVDGSVLATEAELLDAAQRLGHQVLLQIVDGRPPGDDPDLVNASLRYRGVVSFILGHADRLLTLADEPFLAAIEQGQRERMGRGMNAVLLPPAEAYAKARALLLRGARQ